MTQPGGAGELGWLLDDLVSRVGQVRKVVVLSRDGLIMAASRGMDRADAEYLAALAAGFHSLAIGAEPHLAAGRVRQTMIELEDGLFFVVAAGPGSCLALLSESGANAGLIAYEMAMLVKRVRLRLTAQARTAGAGPGAE
jgi:predicted regulator of Ras-like GTPase activity (Roadblock/LC7/MglB family)